MFPSPLFIAIFRFCTILGEMQLLRRFPEQLLQNSTTKTTTSPWPKRALINSEFWGSVKCVGAADGLILG